MSAKIIGHIDLSPMQAQKKKEIEEKQKRIDQQIAIDLCKKADRQRTAGDFLGAVKSCIDAMTANPANLRAGDILGEITVDRALKLGLSNPDFRNIVGALPKAMRMPLLRDAEKAVEKRDAQEIAIAHKTEDAQAVVKKVGLSEPLNPAFALAFAKLPEQKRTEIVASVDPEKEARRKRSAAARKAAQTRRENAKKARESQQNVG
jgi:hypothetical protein